MNYNRKIQMPTMPFILLFWILNLLVGFNEGQQQDVCRSLQFTQPTKGHALVGHVITSFQVSRESACEVSCFLEENCVSWNLGPLQDGKHVCELSESDHHVHPEDLINRAGFLYEGTKKNFCISNTCQPSNTIRCQNGFTERGFRCICKPGYNGSNCEEVIPRVATSPQIISTERGNQVTFTCSATGPPEPVITWDKSQGSLPASRTVNSEGILTILNVDTDDSGLYMCSATNSAGTNSSSVELIVVDAFVCITNPTSSVVLYVGKALNMSCPTSSESVLWFYNETSSLPQDTLIETPNVLLIPSLSTDHGGNYSCVSGNSLQWNVSVYVMNYMYAETCSTVKQNSVSGYYVIDPDGEQGEAPFTVFCNMTDRGGIGVTVVSHNSENRTHVMGFENPGSYARNISYIGTSLSQIKGLIAASKNCRQFIKYECKGSLMTYDFTYYAWWVSREGENMTYWSEESETSHGCACGVTSTCSNPQRLCNCDKNDFVWREDSGMLTNKSHIPVSQLRFGDTGNGEEEGYHTLGKLECYGIN